MKKFILLLLCFSLKIVICQNGFTSYTATLPTNANLGAESAILIDKTNNIWVGFTSTNTLTAVALGCYNGINWTFYSMSNTPVLPTNKINALACDTLGNVWIGTSLGLVMFNGTTFSLFTVANGLPSNNILSLESINNTLYIGTDNGLSRYNGSTFSNYNTTNSLLPLNIITTIKIESAYQLWLGAPNNLIKLNFNSNYTLSTFSLCPITFTCGNVNSIYIDGANNKWIGTSNSPFIIKYDNTNFISANSIYGNLIGTAWPSTGCFDLEKGPNNGVLFLSAVGVSPFANNCIVELLSNNSYKCYYTPTIPYPQSLHLRLGNFMTHDNANNILISRPMPINSVMNLMFNKFNYSQYNSYGQGIGGGVNASNYKFLDINRVKAGIMNRGDMHWDLGGSGNASYEVPKGSSTHSSFASAIWMGGLDASNQLHTAAQMYRQTGNDFWPGPLDTTNAFVDTLTAINYDKIWKVSYTDINNFITQFNLGNVPTSYTPTPDMVSWPAHGTGAKAKNLAPFVDVNGDGIYNWQNGDYPKIKGDQTLYFIFNDNLGAHSETKGLPFGVEIHCMAYAYGCPGILNGRNELAYTTFYDYKVYNRSYNNYHDVSFGYWSDIDLGCYTDDYIASSPQNNLGFCYNSTANDNTCGSNGYGLYPPVLGNTVLKGPLANPNDLKDNDNDSIIDEPNEECLMNVFDYFNNPGGAFFVNTSTPTTKYQYHNYLEGRWKDSTNFTCGGYGNNGITPTKFVYPWTNYLGNPCGSWSELSAGNLAGDRRYVLASGPFNLPAKGMTEVEYALVWSVDSSATSNINIASANKLITDVQKIRNFYKGAKPNCLLSVNIGVNEIEDLNASINLYPNPSTSYIKINSEKNITNSLIELTDITGRTIYSQKSDDLNQTVINTSHLNSGIYFLNIKFDSNKSIVKKFVKQ